MGSAKEYNLHCCNSTARTALQCCRMTTYLTTVVLCKKAASKTDLSSTTRFDLIHNNVFYRPKYPKLQLSLSFSLTNHPPNSYSLVVILPHSSYMCAGSVASIYAVVCSRAQHVQSTPSDSSLLI
jgi:hypothetical protein